MTTAQHTPDRYIYPDTPIEKYQWTTRTINALQHHGIRTFGELRRMPECKLASIRGVGQMGIRQTRQALSLYREHVDESSPGAKYARAKDAFDSMFAALVRLTRNAECTCADGGPGFVCDVCEGRAALAKAEGKDAA